MKKITLIVIVVMIAVIALSVIWFAPTKTIPTTSSVTSPPPIQYSLQLGRHQLSLTQMQSLFGKGGIYTAQINMTEPNPCVIFNITTSKESICATDYSFNDSNGRDIIDEYIYEFTNTTNLQYEWHRQLHLGYNQTISTVDGMNYTLSFSPAESIQLIGTKGNVIVVLWMDREPSSPFNMSAMINTVAQDLS